MSKETSIPKLINGRLTWVPPEIPEEFPTGIISEDRCGHFDKTYDWRYYIVNK